MFYISYTTGVYVAKWNFSLKMSLMTITLPVISLYKLICLTALLSGSKRKKWLQLTVLNLCISVCVSFWQSDRAPYAGSWCQSPSECLSLPLYLCATQAAHRISHHLCSSSFHMQLAFIPCQTSSHCLAASHALKGATHNTHTNKNIKSHMLRLIWAQGHTVVPWSR